MIGIQITIWYLRRPFERASLHNPSIAPSTSKTQTGPATVPTEAPQQETSENVSKLPSPPPPELHAPGGSKDAGKSTANGTEAGV